MENVAFSILKFFHLFEKCILDILSNKSLFKCTRHLIMNVS